MDFLILDSLFSFLYLSSSIIGEVATISFQFYYWRSSKRKILEKSQIITTYTHYIIYKFQLNPLPINEVINFLRNF